MTDRLLDIDHLMINVPDAEAAGAAFEALGFTVTPLSAMPGLANRLVCFSDTQSQQGVCNYIELMALTDAEVAPPPMPALLGQPLGPVSTVMAADDARAVQARLLEAGMNISSVLDLQRDWHLPGGETITPAFAVAIPHLDQSPFYWNFCQHKTPQHYVRSDFVGHKNAVTRLAAVMAVHPDPKEAAMHYRAAWQCQVSGDDPVVLSPGAVDLEIFSSDAFENCFGEVPRAPCLAALRLKTSDIETTHEVMSENGAVMREHGMGFVVASACAANTLLVVEPL